MKIVFYKRSFDWPARTGATVHAGNLMRQLAARGHDVQFWTQDAVDCEAVEWLHGVEHQQLESTDADRLDIGWWANRSLQYWGDDRAKLACLGEWLTDQPQDAVVGVGPDTLPGLVGCRGVRRVWYPADDPVLHKLSLRGIRNKRAACVMAVYQALLKSAVDVTWVVSKEDRRWSRRVGGGRVCWLPNGVDTEYYKPRNVPQEPKSCIFWGNLAFGPNHDAVEYLLNSIWPMVRQAEPGAQMLLCGCKPGQRLRFLIDQRAGVKLLENLPDLRDTVSSAQAAVFPLITGAGVKNKVLEAAAMGKPILASRRCLFGLAGERPPLRICESPKEWRDGLATLWAEHDQRVSLGRDARRWVETYHRWEQTAVLAEQSLEEIL